MIRVTAILVVASAFAPGVADASRLPSTRERVALTAVTRAFMAANPDCCSTLARVKLSCLRVSTVNPDRAALLIAPVKASPKSYPYPILVLLRRRSLTSRWSVRAFGSGTLEIPPRAEIDLLHGLIACGKHLK